MIAGDVPFQADLAERGTDEPALVVDETYTLSAEAPDVMTFILNARPESAGYIGHYFEQTPAELNPPPGVSARLVRAIEWFPTLSRIKS